MSEAFLRMVEEAHRLVKGPRSFEQTQRFLDAVREWVRTQPEWLKKSLVGRVTAEGVQAWTREELPAVLEKSPELLMAFAKLLTTVPLDEAKTLINE